MADFSSVEVTMTKSGCRLRLRVHPRARRTGLEGCHGGALKVSVREPADKGAANRAVTMLLSKVLGVSTGSVSLVAGKASRDKVVVIAGMSVERCRDRLAAWSAGDGRGNTPE